MPYNPPSGGGVGYRQPTTQFWRPSTAVAPRTAYRQPMPNTRRMGDTFTTVGDETYDADASGNIVGVGSSGGMSGASAGLSTPVILAGLAAVAGAFFLFTRK